MTEKAPEDMLAFLEEQVAKAVQAHAELRANLDLLEQRLRVHEPPPPLTLVKGGRDD